MEYGPFLLFLGIFSLLAYGMYKYLPQKLYGVMFLLMGLYFMLSIGVFFVLLIAQGAVPHGILWLNASMGLFYGAVVTFVMAIKKLKKRNRR